MDVLVPFLLLQNCTMDLVSRDEWHAKPPKSMTPMKNPVPYVIIHHSVSPKACYTQDDCIRALQSMQNYHQETKKWSDIGYNFAVGGDNRAYVGRGWSTQGAHAGAYNPISIGICVIGDWSKDVPPSEQLQTIKQLIQCGVDSGFISNDYILYGHRQVRSTECPGDAFYKEIQTWPHYSPQ